MGGHQLDGEVLHPGLVGKRYVVDTGPLMAGWSPEEGDRCLVPPEVLDELERQGVTHYEILSRGLVTTFPSKGAQAIVREHAERTGDLDVLSPADLAVLALAGDESATLVTDDYAVQNVASVLGIETMAVEQAGIERTIAWEWYCGACGQHTADSKGECAVCGTELKRRPARR